MNLSVGTKVAGTWLSSALPSHQSLAKGHPILVMPTASSLSWQPAALRLWNRGASSLREESHCSWEWCTCTWEGPRGPGAQHCSLQSLCSSVVPSTRASSRGGPTLAFVLWGRHRTAHNLSIPQGSRPVWWVSPLIPVLQMQTSQFDL